MKKHRMSASAMPSHKGKLVSGHLREMLNHTMIRKILAF